MLINRNFRLLAAGQAVSLTGDYVFDTTLTLWVGTVLLAGRSYAPAAVAGLLVTVAVATLLVAPLAGVFVDRWNRRRTMLAADLIRAALIGGVAVLAFLPAGTVATGAMVAVVYAAVFLSAAVSQFFSPARFAMIGEVVGEQDRGRAAGIGQSVQGIAAILGPPLAAPLLFTAGVRWALVLNALSFLVSFALVRGVWPEPRAVRPAAGRQGVGAELVAGLRTVASSAVVKALLTTVVLCSIGFAALNSVNVFFVTDNLHVAAKWYGTLDMLLGVGLLVGATMAAPLGQRFGHRRTFPLGLLGAGALLLWYSRMTQLWPALALVTVLGVALAVFNAAVAPLLIAAVPPQYLGRVFSVIGPVQQVASVAGMSMAGWFASSVPRGFHADLGGLRVGRIDMIISCSGLLTVAGALYALYALRERAAVRPVGAQAAVPEAEA
ncbi:MFS family permease [Kitasatospora sp. MAP12-15]|uniref:MFS transporter n=1 Tax=unclassified Kitasatospora TaxID=2633591 RepID=UPI002474EB05|nr:MFS transporter [Kitasatospora sp. MAP12-44]MDH6112371.1 MFS family permease [Kitasatospora sp. MAP12-44]